MCYHMNNLWKIVSIKTPKLQLWFTFIQEVGDVSLELVSNTDLPLISQQCLLLRVIHQWVEEGILGNTDGRKAWGWNESNRKRDGQTQRWKRTISFSACACMYVPPLLVSCLLITVCAKNILGQHAELFIWKQGSLNTHTHTLSLRYCNPNNPEIVYETPSYRLAWRAGVHTSLSRYDFKASVSFSSVTQHFPLEFSR